MCEGCNGIEKSSLYLTLFAKCDMLDIENPASGGRYRTEVIIDNIQTASIMADFVSEYFGIEAMVTVGKNYEDSEMVYWNKSYADNLMPGYEEDEV